MKFLKSEESERFERSLACTVTEYPLGDKDIDCCVVEIDGRYPDKGYALNKECKELIYVMSGSGTLTINETEVEFSEGDVVIIDKGETYFWDARCKVLMPCTPAWYPEQYENVDDIEL